MWAVRISKNKIMNSKQILGWSSALCLGASALQAQETSEVETLKRQLKQATESFRKAIDEQRRVVDELNRRIETIEKPKPVPAPASIVGDVKAPANGQASATKPWSAADPMRVQRGSAYLDIGLVGNIAVGGSTAKDIEGGTQLGGHDPNQRGFTLQGLEAAFAGAVDPYFRGNANLMFAVDSGGESFMEVEEAWLETSSLPGNLALRAGQIWTEFGRHNSTHLHTWSFVDAPLVNGRFFGADGLRNPGARVSWLAPLPFYSELSLGVQNSQGETASGFRSAGQGHGGGEVGLPISYRHSDNDRGVKQFGDLLFSPRSALSFDLSDTQVLLGGVSAAFGPNSRGSEGSGATDTQIYGVDLTWKWKPVNHSGGFPFVLWQTEAMLQRYDAGGFDWDENGNAATDDGELVNVGTGLPAVLPGETLTDYGFYSQVLYGFRKSWVAGVRFDYVTSDRADYERLDLTFNGESVSRDPMRATRWRISPNLTWYPTEFSKVRLQYNYDDRREVGVDHSVWLQFEFLLGAHAAHKF